MQSAGAASSSEYRIFETEEFRKALKRLGPTGFLPRKLNAYVYPQLRQSPHFGPNIRRLRGYAPPTWRYRTGRYRLFYIVDESERVVFLLTIDHRKDAYG